MYQVICVDIKIGQGFWNKVNLVKLMIVIICFLNYLVLFMLKFDVFLLYFIIVIVDMIDID